jgi:4-hydroxyacetophenone monooxygenase
MTKSIDKDAKNKAEKGNGYHRDIRFVRQAVDSAGMNALRMALYQATGDPDLALMPITKKKVRGGVLFDYTLSDDDQKTVRRKAVE